MRGIGFAFFLFALMISFAIAQANAPNAVAVGSSLLLCGHVWDGKNETLRGPVVIRIEREKIVEIKEPQSSSNSLRAVDKEPTIDLSHETCLPGLIDTHTHIHRTIPPLMAAMEKAGWKALSICDSREIGDEPSGLAEMIRGTIVEWHRQVFRQLINVI